MVLYPSVQTPVYQCLALLWGHYYIVLADNDEYGQVSWEGPVVVE